jgi:hypothetical protein
MATQPFSECVKRDTMRCTLQPLVEKPPPPKAEMQWLRRIGQNQLDRIQNGNNGRI